jgi:hypothetical protein
VTPWSTFGPDPSGHEPFNLLAREVQYTVRISMQARRKMDGSEFVQSNCFDFSRGTLAVRQKSPIIRFRTAAEMLETVGWCVSEPFVRIPSLACGFQARVGYSVGFHRRHE